MKLTKISRDIKDHPTYRKKLAEIKAREKEYLKHVVPKLKKFYKA